MLTETTGGTLKPWGWEDVKTEDSETQYINNPSSLEIEVLVVLCFDSAPNVTKPV